MKYYAFLRRGLHFHIEKCGFVAPDYEEVTEDLIQSRLLFPHTCVHVLLSEQTRSLIATLDLSKESRLREIEIVLDELRKEQQ